MQQIIQNTKTGKLEVLELPNPQCDKNGVLIQNYFSLISTGTESRSIATAQSSMLGKAKMRPDLVEKVINHYKKNGLLSTYKLIDDRLNSPIPLGYSCVGKVIEVGYNVDSIKKNDMVACGGAGFASHSTLNYVPRNLIKKVPNGVSLQAASYTTVGAIAMQGVRQSNIQIGSNVAVIGLGLVGQLTSQILKAGGCRVFGLDINDYQVEMSLGGFSWSADFAFNSKKSDAIKKILSLTDNIGVDSVIITAASNNNGPILQAGELIRDRGKVVIVGATEMSIPRSPFYDKEAEIIFSRSYGPGRYDKNYEEKGLDYPIGQVRWTENRNMESFLNLIATKKINPEHLTTDQFKIEDSVQAFDLITNDKSKKFMGVLITYNSSLKSIKNDEKIENKEISGRPLKDINIGYIGLGNYAKQNIMTFLKKDKSVQFHIICNKTPLSSENELKRYNFKSCTTNPDELFKINDIDTVFISSRHDTHSKFIIESIKLNKNIFVEKPIAINKEELEQIKIVKSNNYNRLFHVGYNRRFAPISMAIDKNLIGNVNPISIFYRISAGKIPSSHWIQDAEIGGGRIIGEVCHFVDYSIFLTKSKIISVFASTTTSNSKNHPGQDNIHVQLIFANGSIATICYLSDGSKKIEKEYIEIFGDESTYIVEDFKRLSFFSENTKKTLIKGPQNKGHENQIRMFLDRCLEGKNNLITFNEILNGMDATFAIIDSIYNKKVINL